jgi:thioredoxin-related protein
MALDTGLNVKDLLEDCYSSIYKNPVRTSQETHYVSATERNRLMLFGEAVALFIVRTVTEHTDTVRTSEETHHVSTKETNRLMLFGKTVAVYCEPYGRNTHTVRTSQETRYASATQANRLMLFGVTAAVYCENHKEHTNTVLYGSHSKQRLICLNEKINIHKYEK